jgi:hypothetical protein
MRRGTRSLYVPFALLLCACSRGSTPPPVADAEPVGPTMPTGMLMPVKGYDAATAPLAERMRASHAPREGWFELIGGGDAGTGPRLWVSVSAFSRMEIAFARVEPGFGPFGSHVVPADALPKLAAELRSLGDGGGPGEEALDPEAKKAFETTTSEVASMATTLASSHTALVVVTP